MKWESHVVHISASLAAMLKKNQSIEAILSKVRRKLLYNAMVLPYLNYCCVIWGTVSKSLLHKLIILQNKVVGIIDDQPRLSHTSLIFFAKLKFFNDKKSSFYQILMLMHNAFMEDVHQQLRLSLNSKNPDRNHQESHAIVRIILPVSHPVHMPLAGLDHDRGTP